MTDIYPLVQEAASLMLVGMMFVFAFLTLLIIAIQVIAKACASEPEASLAQAASGGMQEQGTEGHQQPDRAIVAAISAAITQYRTDHDIK